MFQLKNKHLVKELAKSLGIPEDVPGLRKAMLERWREKCRPICGILYPLVQTVSFRTRSKVMVSDATPEVQDALLPDDEAASDASNISDSDTTSSSDGDDDTEDFDDFAPNWIDHLTTSSLEDEEDEGDLDYSIPLSSSLADDVSNNSAADDEVQLAQLGADSDGRAEFDMSFDEVLPSSFVSDYGAIDGMLAGDDACRSLATGTLHKCFCVERLM